MKLVDKCSAFVSPSYQVDVKVCNPIPLSVSTNFQVTGCNHFQRINHYHILLYKPKLQNLTLPKK